MLYNEITYAIYDELKYATSQHPSYPKDPIHQIAIISEEVGEAVKESIEITYRNKPKDDLRQGVIQIAAMCYRYLLNE